MELETWQAPPGDRIPNHPAFPVLLYRDVDAAAAGADECRALFAEHGWVGSWVDGVFGFHHFHSTSHEVLGVVAGRATLELGGPLGRAFEVSSGDVVVLPAGTGHRRASSDAESLSWAPIPPGRRSTTSCGEDPGEVAEARERIARLETPPQDPVGGDGLARWWR